MHAGNFINWILRDLPWPFRRFLRGSSADSPKSHADSLRACLILHKGRDRVACGHADCAPRMHCAATSGPGIPGGPREWKENDEPMPGDAYRHRPIIRDSFARTVAENDPAAMSAASSILLKISGLWQKQKACIGSPRIRCTPLSSAGMVIGPPPGGHGEHCGPCSSWSRASRAQRNQESVIFKKPEVY
jgi:hypothetical protein